MSDPIQQTTDEREPTPTEMAVFRRAANALAKLGRAGLHIYFDDDNLNLLTGPSHDDRARARQDRVRETVCVPRGGGGGW